MQALEVPESLDAGYRMIESLEISNFRGFKQLSLSNLSQFNFVIGASGSGKTALLEACWIVGGISPEIYFRMRGMRGMGGSLLQIRQDRQGYEGVFRDIFYEVGDNPRAAIHILDSKRGDRSLVISYEADNGQLTLDVDSPDRGTVFVRPIVFDWQLGKEHFVCPLKFVNGQIVVASPPAVFPALFISSSQIVDSAENAGRLSDLNIRKQKTTIVASVRKIYPLVEDLTTEVVGGQAMIYASLESQPAHIPLPVVSSGINKLMSILLGVEQYAGGVIIIDEMENGFYYRNYEEILSSIVDLCSQRDVQLFASTHSYEFLQAVSRVMAGRESKFSLLRTERKNAACSVSLIPGVSSKAAIEQDIELR